MLKTGEFSKLSRTSIRMLRFYDETGLLIPEMVDDFTGYRYYGEAQLPAAQRIQALKDLGFTLSVISEILKRYEDADSMEQFLSVKREEILGRIKEDRQRLQLLDNTIKWLRKDGSLMDYNVTLKVLPERNVASVRQVIPAYHNEGMLWQILMEAVEMASATFKGSYAQITGVNMAVAQWVRENGYEFEGPSFCIYHVSPNDAPNEEELVTEVCCPVKKKA